MTHYIADTFFVYENGIRRPETHTLSKFTSRSLGMIENREDHEIVFGRLETRLDGSYCNCQVDEVQIFETELNAAEVNALFSNNYN